MIVREFIQSALRKIGAYASGEQPTDQEMNDALSELNTMLYDWSTEPNGIYKFVQENFSFTGIQKYTYGDGWVLKNDDIKYNSPDSIKIDGDFTSIYTVGTRAKITGKTTGIIYGTILTSVYTVPPTNETVITFTLDSGTIEDEVLTIYLDEGQVADFDSERPSKILNCYYRDVTTDRTIQQTTTTNWAQITTKSIGNYPRVFLYEPDFPIASIYFYPVPVNVNQVFFICLKPLIQYTDLTNELDLPPEYERAIKWNLASELITEYGDNVSPIVLQRAAETLKKLKLYHAQQNGPAQISSYPSRPHDDDSRYNIFEGYYNG